MCWLFKQPGALAPPSLDEVGGTVIAGASLEQSCVFLDWGSQAIRGRRLVSADPCSGIGKCGRRNYEQVSNGLAQSPFLRLLSASRESGGDP